MKIKKSAEEEVHIRRKLEEIDELEEEDYQEQPSKWYKYLRKYTHEERRLFILVAVQAALEVCFGTKSISMRKKLYR